MKKLYCLSVLLFPCTMFAQLHITGLSNNAGNVLIKVIEDYPNHFNNIRGAVIDKDVQLTTYASFVNFPDADSAIIMQNGELKDDIFSWKETVFQSDDFNTIKAKFHEYYKKINGTSVNINNHKIIFDADYAEPDDDKQFSAILFLQHPPTDALKNVVIDLSLHYLMDSWQITISVYEHTDYGVNKN